MTQRVAEAAEGTSLQVCEESDVARRAESSSEHANAPAALGVVDMKDTFGGAGLFWTM